MDTVTNSPFEVVQSNFVMFARDNIDPAKIPQHIAEYYDRAFATYMNFRHYAGCRDIPPNDWPIICLLAEQQRQIDELKGLLGQGKAESSDATARGPAVSGPAGPRGSATRRGKPKEVRPDGG